jgi:hypothetical protein
MTAIVINKSSYSVIQFLKTSVKIETLFRQASTCSTITLCKINYLLYVFCSFVNCGLGLFFNFLSFLNGMNKGLYELNKGLYVLDAGFFSVENLALLCENRILCSQIKMLFEHVESGKMNAIFN